MREIKFRGRSSKDNKTWFTGSFVSLDEEAYIEHFDGLRRVMEIYPVAPPTVGQFTGLSDVDGREIYEGDIVSWGDGTPPTSVRWDEHFAYYVIMESLILSHACKAVRVIGNMHDNPKLLEVRKP